MTEREWKHGVPTYSRLQQIGGDNEGRDNNLRNHALFAIAERLEALVEVIEQVRNDIPQEPVGVHVENTVDV